MQVDGRRFPGSVPLQAGCLYKLAVRVRPDAHLAQPEPAPKPKAKSPPTERVQELDKRNVSG